MPHQTCASGANMLTMKTLGLTTHSNARGATSPVALGDNVLAGLAEVDDRREDEMTRSALRAVERRIFDYLWYGPSDLRCLQLSVALTERNTCYTPVVVMYGRSTLVPSKLAQEQAALL